MAKICTHIFFSQMLCTEIWLILRHHASDKDIQLIVENKGETKHKYDKNYSRQAQFAK